MQPKINSVRFFEEKIVGWKNHFEKNLILVAISRIFVFKKIMLDSLLLLSNDNENKVEKGLSTVI